MTKPKLQNKCKLCNLIHKNKDLWLTVHDKILQDGLTRTKVCNWLNKQVEVLNANLSKGDEAYPKFNNSNFTNHFSKHVPDIDKMKAELRAAARQEVRANDGFSAEESLLAETVSGLLGDGSYNEYPDTVLKLERFIMHDLKSDKAILDSGGNLRTSAAEGKLRLLQTLITVKQKLADVQRSEQVGGSAVRQAMARVGEEVISSMNKIAREVRDLLSASMPNSQLPAEVEEMLVARMLATLKGSYPEILEDVYKDYGIK